MMIALVPIQYHPADMNEALLNQAYDRFDAANALDPNAVVVDGVEQPKELVFAKRLTDAVLKLDPEASVELRLASRCQHICRWKVPRSTQPMGRAGYLKWRSGLKKYHAEISAGILADIGYDDQTIQRVQDLNQKKNLKTDPDCQTLEDALCLVFLEHQFDMLIAHTEEEKMLKIVQKTWRKMSKRGQEKAAQLDYSKLAAGVLEKALGDN